MPRRIWPRNRGKVRTSIVNRVLWLVRVDWRLVCACWHGHGVWPRGVDAWGARVHLLHVGVGSRGDAGWDACVCGESDVRRDGVRRVPAYVVVDGRHVLAIMSAVPRHKVVTKPRMVRHVFASIKSTDWLVTMVQKGSVFVLLSRVNVFIRQKSQNVVCDDVDAFFVP